MSNLSSSGIENVRVLQVRCKTGFSCVGSANDEDPEMTNAIKVSSGMRKVRMRDAFTVGVKRDIVVSLSVGSPALR